MKLVVFGLSISSSWGNGHATVWRGLCRALGARGHVVEFFERDVPYYATHRDRTEVPGARLHLYADWDSVVPRARAALSGADAAMVTSYCPDGLAATDLVLSSPVPRRVFYDLDTPVTLGRRPAGERVPYVGPRGLRDFDLVLSDTGGRALSELQGRLGARYVVPLYGSVDPDVHRPVARVDRYDAHLSYLGTCSADRQAALQALFIEPARRRPSLRFLMAGSLHPASFPWTANIHFLRHLPPGEHSAFYCSSRLTLNVTRGAMARMGYCPSGRLFEAAACGTPVLSDEWEGLDRFFEPGREILVARTSDEAMDAVSLPPSALQAVARAARERALAEHTAEHRGRELEVILERSQPAEPSHPARLEA
jgi:spore maturation protein CgeB